MDNNCEFKITGALAYELIFAFRTLASVCLVFRNKRGISSPDVETFFLELKTGLRDAVRFESNDELFREIMRNLKEELLTPPDTILENSSMSLEYLPIIFGMPNTSLVDKLVDSKVRETHSGERHIVNAGVGLIFEKIILCNLLLEAIPARSNNVFVKGTGEIAMAISKFLGGSIGVSEIVITGISYSMNTTTVKSIFSENREPEKTRVIKIYQQLIIIN